ncbi:multidrug-efflux system secretion protein [Stappia sp. 22II-S9-Z10]|nr:multidrug-efflux system secretion protein [Stappia sp. 22II-S9-Z10]
MIIIRLTLTIVIVVAAVFSGIFLWTNIFAEPWTRDAHIRADLVEIAPQVSGPVTEVAVSNNQMVTEGDVLFQIDRVNYELALEEARATMDAAEAAADDAGQRADRYRRLKASGSASVADVDVLDAELSAKSANASLAQARAALQRAEADLKRTTVLAPVTGRITNLTADTGDYVNTGSPALTIVDTASFRVDAFFMETKLPRIRPGDSARIRLMASGEVVRGRVTGISAGISFGEDGSGSMLQAPEPSFQWVRLAQRVPVEVSLDTLPTSVPLINGTTVTVIVEPSGEEAPLWQRLMDGGRRVLGLAG